MSTEPTLPLSSILDALLDTVFLVDRSGRIVHVSQACEALLGYRPDEMVGQPLQVFQAPEDRDRTDEEACRVLAGEARVGFENRYVHKQGHAVHIMWSARWSPDLSMRVGVARDVTALRRAGLLQAAAYAVSEAAHTARDLSCLCAQVHTILQGLVNIADFTVVTCAESDGAVRAVYQSGAQAPIQNLGAGPGEWGAGACGLPAVGELAHGWLVLRLDGQKGLLGAMLLRHPDVADYTAADQDLLKFVAAQVGVAVERKHLYDSLLRAATHDVLTGLPNRRLFEERLGSAVRRARRANGRFALLYLDVDRFKEINDRFGHAAGDAVLQEIGRRLSQCARETDTVARIGGDEFVLLAEDLATVQDADFIAHKLREALHRPLVLGLQSLPLEASIGIAVFPDDAGQGDQLLSLADGAMYLAKQEGCKRHSPC
jgi:diguanylate cyclase (GGDEF)-like protein/PAS domain S-box-containing protein